jgi:hypothetical protein
MYFFLPQFRARIIDDPIPAHTVTLYAKVSRARSRSFVYLHVKDINQGFRYRFWRAIRFPFDAVMNPKNCLYQRQVKTASKHRQTPDVVYVADCRSRALRDSS